MKLSVYVSDELWEQAQGQLFDATPSKVVQEGLRHLITHADAERQGVRAAAALAGSPFESMKSRLLEQARSDYDAGVEVGMKIAQRMEWRDLQMAHHTGALESFVSRVEDVAERSSSTLYERAQELEAWIEKVTGWTRFVPDEDSRLNTFSKGFTFRAGIWDALEELWRSVAAEIPSSAIRVPTAEMRHPSETDVDDPAITP